MNRRDGLPNISKHAQAPEWRARSVAVMLATDAFYRGFGFSMGCYTGKLWLDILTFVVFWLIFLGFSREYSTALVSVKRGFKSAKAFCKAFCAAI